MKIQVHGAIVSGILQLHVTVPEHARVRALVLPGQTLIEEQHVTLLRIDHLGIDVTKSTLPEPPRDLDFREEIYVVNTGKKCSCYLIATDAMQELLLAYTRSCAECLGIPEDSIDSNRIFHVTISNAGNGDVRASVGSPWDFSSNILEA